MLGPLHVSRARMIAAATWLLACSPAPAPEQAPLSPPEDPPAAEPSSVPAPVPSETSNGSESGETQAEHDDDESGTGDEPPSTETGTTPTGSARLCSRPYTVSTSPGKGAMTREPSSAASGAARRRLAAGLSVTVDALAPQPWTPKLGVEFDGLDPAAVHTIEVHDARGDRLTRLTLNFVRRGSEDLCLGFSSFYGTWQLRALRSGARCGPCVTR